MRAGWRRCVHGGGGEELGAGLVDTRLPISLAVFSSSDICYGKSAQMQGSKGMFTNS